jgi:4-diphosphocytidyl-2-C-methyl-D-erythritol kinase
MALRTLVPAKINLTLEVLGKRDDGYHEIRSVMQTIDVVDQLSLDRADELSLVVEGPHTASDDDLVLKAARAAGAVSEVSMSGSFRLKKRIPTAAGLGGGSADAAAAIRLLNQDHNLGLTRQTMATAAASVSSDAAFFCFGGTALVRGRGEVVEPLPDARPFWIAVLTPDASMPEKTRQMYDALKPEDFTRGDATERLAARMRRREAIANADLHNAFDRAAYRMFDGLSEHRDALLKAGATAVHVAGSGPALFTLASSEADAREIARPLGNSKCRVDVARSTSADDAIAVQE